MELAGVDDGAAAIGVGTVENQGSNPVFRKGVGGAFDGTSDGERPPGDIDRPATREGDNPGAKIQVLRIGECEVLIPVLRIIL